MNRKLTQAGVAVVTKFHGPTNTKGARVSASTGMMRSHRLYHHWDHELSAFENHRAVAMAFIQERKWDGQWIGGATKDGYAFVCVPKETES
jgi:hypothetical protein